MKRFSCTPALKPSPERFVSNASSTFLKFKLHPDQFFAGSLLILLIGILGGIPCDAAAQDIEFAETGTLMLTWEALQQKPAKLVVFNKKSTGHRVQVRLLDTGSGPDSHTLSKLLTVDTVIDLREALATTVTVASVQDASPPSGTYTGHLVLFEENSSGSSPIRKQVVLQVNIPALPKPLLPKWTAHLTQKIPWDRDAGKQFALPLEPGSTADQMAAQYGNTLGYLASDTYDDVVGVRLNDIEDDQERGLPTAHLELFGLPSYASTYTGEIYLSKADKTTSKVSLTVKIKHWWGWAILLLLAGIAVAVVRQHYVMIGREIQLAQDHLDRVAYAYWQAQTLFLERAANRSYQSYSIEDAFTREYNRIAEGLKTLKWTTWGKLSTSDAYKDVLNSIEKMALAVEAWPPFADQLNMLHERLETLTGDPQPLNAQFSKLAQVKLLPDRPDCLVEAQALLRPAMLQLADSPSEFEVCKTAVVEAVRFLEDWTLIATMLSETITTYHKIKASIEPEKQDTLRAQLSLAVKYLWECPLNNKDDLAEIQENVNKLEADFFLLKVPPETYALMQMQRIFDWQASPNSLVESKQIFNLPDKEELVSRRHASYKKRRRYEIGLALLALLLALWSGMEEVYLDDQSFGAWEDYAAAFLWGLGAQIVLTTVFNALGRFLSTWPQPDLRQATLLKIK